MKLNININPRTIMNMKSHLWRRAYIPGKCHFAVGDVVFYRLGICGLKVHESRIKEITFGRFHVPMGYILTMEDGNKTMEECTFKTREEALAAIERLKKSLESCRKKQKELMKAKEGN